MSSSSNEPLADVQIFLPIAGNPAAAAARADAVSDAGGNFVITNVPVGRLILRAQIAGYFASPVDGVTPVALRVPVTVVADQGIVVETDQKPVPSSTIVFIPQAGRRQNPALYKTIRSDANGRFTLSPVAPGAYKLFASQSIPPGAYQNADFISKYDERLVISCSAKQRAEEN